MFAKALRCQIGIEQRRITLGNLRPDCLLRPELGSSLFDRNGKILCHIGKAVARDVDSDAIRARIG